MLSNFTMILIKTVGIFNFLAPIFVYLYNISVKLKGKPKISIKKVKNNCVINQSFSKIIIWNSNSKVIRYNDISKKCPIKIGIGGNAKIQDAYIIDKTSEINDINLINIDDNEYKIEFEYLEKNEGCMVQVLHTCPNDEEVFFSGKLIGGNRLDKYNKKKLIESISDIWNFKVNRFFINKLRLIIGIIYLPIAIILFLNNSLSIESYEVPYNVLIVIVLFISTYYWLSFWIFRVNNRYPKKFRKEFLNEKMHIPDCDDISPSNNDAA